MKLTESEQAILIAALESVKAAGEVQARKRGINPAPELMDTIAELQHYFLNARGVFLTGVSRPSTKPRRYEVSGDVVNMFERKAKAPN
jgi:hypothetical protein